MKTVTVKRLSNFEFIRIIAMFFIVISHYAQHGLLPEIETKTTIVKFLTMYLHTLGSIGVVLFVLLTGYFMIDKKFSIRHFFNVAIETIFYSYGILIISALFFKDYITLTPITIYKSIFPILTGQYWFVTSYLMLYLTIPLINKLFDILDRTTFKRYLLFFLFIWTFIPLLGYKIGLARSSLTGFICIYYIGAYIKRYGITFFENKRNIILTIIVPQAIICLYQLVYLIINYLDEGWFMHIAWSGSILAITTSVSIFTIIKNCKIKFNSTINYFSSSAFAVYLFTENIIISKVLWTKIFRCNHSPDFLFMFFNMIFAVTLSYIICTFIDKLRVKIFKEHLINLAEKIYNKAYIAITQYI